MNESTKHNTWRVSSQRTIQLDRPLCIGILNITPDSFFDGGELSSQSKAVDRAKSMIDDGADGLDIGGESTRPGAERVSEQEQINRVVPVIKSIRSAGIEILISVDTTRAKVALAAIDAGADVINDVSAGSEDEEILNVASKQDCGLILMHRAILPELDQYSDQYEDGQRPISDSVVDRVVKELSVRREFALQAGVGNTNIVLDPGLGFGKDVDQNLALIRQTGQFLKLGHPVMSALSRKSFVGRLSLDRDSTPKERLWGTIGLSVLHLQLGARIFRVHDVAAHRESLDASWRLIGEG
ncbi:MAG: dihydropteroate synthase [Phycisphaerales bacterium]|nr:dihydropteroate synthase [Phycisphaerales bacterium]